MIRVNNANIESFVAPNYAETLLPELNTAQGNAAVFGWLPAALIL